MPHLEAILCIIENRASAISVAYIYFQAILSLGILINGILKGKLCSRTFPIFVGSCLEKNNACFCEIENYLLYLEMTVNDVFGRERKNVA